MPIKRIAPGMYVDEANCLHVVPQEVRHALGLTEAELPDERLADMTAETLGKFWRRRIPVEWTYLPLGDNPPA